MRRLQRHVGFVPILLKKSFGGGERNFPEPLMCFVRNDVRDHVVSQKNDHGLSYWRYAASQRRTCPKINICEIFGVFRFSTFSTVSARSGSRPCSINSSARARIAGGLRDLPRKP